MLLCVAPLHAIINITRFWLQHGKEWKKTSKTLSYTFARHCKCMTCKHCVFLSNHEQVRVQLLKVAQAVHRWARGVVVRQDDDVVIFGGRGALLPFYAASRNGGQHTFSINTSAAKAEVKQTHQTVFHGCHEIKYVREKLVLTEIQHSPHKCREIIP